MPYQVSGQLVERKSQTLPHVAGGGGAFVTTGAFVIMTSLSAATAAPAHATSNAAQKAADTPNFFMVVPLPRVHSA
jgi:hypothetical protein